MSLYVYLYTNKVYLATICRLLKSRILHRIQMNFNTLRNYTVFSTNKSTMGSFYKENKFSFNSNSWLRSYTLFLFSSEWYPLLDQNLLIHTQPLTHNDLYPHVNYSPLPLGCFKLSSTIMHDAYNNVATTNISNLFTSTQDIPHYNTRYSYNFSILVLSFSILANNL